MTIPRIFQSSFYYNEEKGVTDCANIITSLEAILLAQTPAWTKLSAGVFKSPVDSAGRFMKLTMTAPAATRLNMLLSDQNGITVCQRELLIAVAGTAINYYTGQYHVYIESLIAPTPSMLGAVIVDPFGYDLNANQNYVMGCGTFTTTGATDNVCNAFDVWFMLESGTPAFRSRLRSWGTTADNTSTGMLDFDGNPQVFPYDVCNVPNGSRVWIGQIPQFYVTTSNVGPQTRKPIAIDDSTPATFKVVAIQSNTNIAARGMWRVA